MSANRCHVRRSKILFDHLVGGDEQVRRDGDALRLGGLQIDHRFELGRILRRKLTRLLAAQTPLVVAP